MKRSISINLGNLLLSLSDTMDRVSPLFQQHQQRTAFIAWELGKAVNLSEDRIERLFVAALLHDIGIFTDEEKKSLYTSESIDTESHCIRGAHLLKTIPWLKDAAKLVRYHHREWKDWKEPIDVPYVLESQIIFLADYLDRSIDRSKYILHLSRDLISKVRTLSGTQVHPDLVELFTKKFIREEFWFDLATSRLHSLLLKNGPYRKKEVDFSEIIPIAELSRDIVDFRSPFTASHSSGVAACAEILSEIFGLTEIEVQLLKITGNFHDLGKLAVPNSILNKPEKLTKREFELVKSHAYYTYAFLNSIEGLEQIAGWAGFHHERLNGAGYPFHCRAAELDTGSRIMAVADIFTAVVEDRPYRRRIPRQKAIELLKDFAKKGLLDDRVVNLLLVNISEVYAHISKAQRRTREFYEKQIVSLNDH